VKQIVTALCSVLALTMLFPQMSSAQFNDTGWTIKYQENFDSAFEGTHGQTFGGDDWLIFQLLNGGRIIIANGYAWLEAQDFQNAALIRSTEVLPDEYKIRTKIGYLNYDLTNYEQADYDNPAFNDHDGWYENGMYFLTITDDTCIGNQCAELWWHYHRKMVIDVDNHLRASGGQVFHPVYMVYMDPTTNEGGNRLRTWDGVEWDESPWNWNVAYTYAYNTWYYAELEKKDGHITLRLYDENKNILENPPPVPLDKVFAMDEPEFFYVGEPHTDDYEGDVRIDEITLLLPSSGCCTGIRGNANNAGDITIQDLTYLVNYLFRKGSAPICIDEANVNGVGAITVSDLTYLVQYLFNQGPTPAACP
jgi:hypothetical protein